MVKDQILSTVNKLKLPERVKEGLKRLKSLKASLQSMKEKGNGPDGPN